MPKTKSGICLSRYLHMDVYSDFICESPRKGKKTQMAINQWVSKLNNAITTQWEKGKYSDTANNMGESQTH